MFLKDFWGAKNFTQIIFTIEKCSQHPIHPYTGQDLGLDLTCKDDKTIHTTLTGAFLSINFKNSIIDYANYENPIMYYFDENFYVLNDLLSISSFYGVQNTDFTNDSGFFLEEKEEERTFSINKPIVNYINSSNNHILFEFIMEGKRNGQHIQRKYTKVQDVITKIGGFIKALLIIGEIISKYFSYMLYYIYMKKHIDLNENLKENLKIIPDFKNQLVSESKEEMKPYNLEKNNPTILKNNLVKMAIATPNHF